MLAVGFGVQAGRQTTIRKKVGKTDRVDFTDDRGGSLGCPDCVDAAAPSSDCDTPGTTSRLRRVIAAPPKRLAVVTMGVKLGDETRGYTRFRFLSGFLAQQGFEVDLITSSFQHWEKEQRDTSKACYRNLPYRVVFIDEPGYTRNLDMKRIRSHAIAAKNM